MSKKYKVELTALAREQIQLMAQYVKEELMAPDAANRLVDRLEAEIGKLDTMPERIVRVDVEPWRSKGVHKYIMDKHIAYFIIIEPENLVRVIAVVLGRMDQKEQLKKTDVADL